jgi:hypothetical protein
MMISGGCLCRTVRYKISAAPIVTRVCWCRLCGTQLFSEAESRPHLIFVRAGTLDDPQVAEPGATIWTEQAPTWACIDSRLPNFPRQAPQAG